MRKRIAAALAAAGFIAVFGTGVASADSMKVDGFVCPTLFSNQEEPPPAVDKDGPFGEIFGGDYTIAGPIVSISENATTSGAPDGPHAQPGDTDYTAIWEGLPPG
jgi:hypothetical protein